VPLNIAGPEYDFGSVVFVVLEECEHRRRGFDDDDAEEQLLRVARGKLAKIKQAYDEFGGSPAYWKVLETEVLETAMPQYIQAAREMTALEHANFGVWRGGDPAARFAFALGGLFLAASTPCRSSRSSRPCLPPPRPRVHLSELKRFTHERLTSACSRLPSPTHAVEQRQAALHDDERDRGRSRSRVGDELQEKSWSSLQVPCRAMARP
jgi:hypothetical protein